MAILLTDANGNFVPQGLLPDGSSFKENVTSATGSQFVNIRNESGTEIFTQTNPGSMQLMRNILEEQLTESDAVNNVLTFSENISAIEIYNSDEFNDGVFTVNGIEIIVPAGLTFKSPIGGTPGTTVSVTGATTYIVSRYE